MARRGAGWLVALALLAAPAAALQGEEGPEVLGQPAGWAVEAEAAAPVVDVLEGSVLHAEPDRGSAVLAVLPDCRLPLAEARGRWVRVRYGEIRGWVDLEAPRTPEDAPGGGGGLFADEEPLELGAGWQREELGGYTFYSRVDEPALIDYLGRIAGDHARLYAERYGLAAAGAGGRVLLFPDRQAVLEFQRRRGRGLLESRLAGYFRSPDLVVMYRGFHSRQELAATLIHELTHLLSWRALRGGGRLPAAVPPWLEEGIADDLALSMVDRRGRLRAEPLGPGNLQYGRRLGAVVWRLEQRIVADGTAPSLPSLLAMGENAFFAADGELHYQMSSLWIRYLLSGVDDGLAEGFRAYLASVAAGGGSHPDLLVARLGRTWPELAAGFRGYLLRQRARLVR